jgi:hypothetical protein
LVAAVVVSVMTLNPFTTLNPLEGGFGQNSTPPLTPDVGREQCDSVRPSL